MAAVFVALALLAQSPADIAAQDAEAAKAANTAAAAAEQGNAARCHPLVATVARIKIARRTTKAMIERSAPDSADLHRLNWLASAQAKDLKDLRALAGSIDCALP